MDAPGNVRTTATVQLDSLTSLRWIAALAVFGTHTVGRLSPGDTQNVVDAIAGHGSVGVSFFFILSGFVLTWSHRSSDTARQFYRRRFARIAPAYWACLAAATFYLIAVTGDPATLWRALPSVPALQSWIPNEDIYYAGNGVGWSISTEAFFYAVFPAMVLMLGSNRGRLGALAVAAVLVLALPLVLRPDDIHTASYWAIYILPLDRLGEFVVGMLVAAAMRSGGRSPVGLWTALAIALAAYATIEFVPLWASVSLVTILPFALVIAAAATADLDGAPGLRQRWLVALGQWSFAFYLTHQLILRVESRFVEGRGAPAEVVGVVVAFGVSLMASWVLYTFVERPSERRLRKAPSRAEAAN